MTWEEVVWQRQHPRHTAHLPGPITLKEEEEEEEEREEEEKKKRQRHREKT